MGAAPGRLKSNDQTSVGKGTSHFGRAKCALSCMDFLGCGVLSDALVFSVFPGGICTSLAVTATVANMVRKATWSVLLLLLASVQSLAMTCGVRCALMTMPSVQSSMPGMEHCEGMSSGSESARHGVQSSQQCSSSICGDDLAVVKSPEAVVERTDIALSPLSDVIFRAFDLSPVSSQKAWPPPTGRSRTTLSNLNPLLSNLRV